MLYRHVLLLTGCVLFFCNNAFAGIIDTNHNSFIDQKSGIEWMDFGVNNHMTYSEVTSLLSKDKLFHGWRLPTETEALDLWYNAFKWHDSAAFGKDYRKDGLNNNYYIAGSALNSTYTSYEPLREYRSRWDDAFDAMSFNEAYREGTDRAFKISIGLFLNNEGNISALYFQNITHANRSDVVQATGAMGQMNSLIFNEEIQYSTLLIKVNEPTTVVIFGLSMFGLILTRKRMSKL